MNINRNNYESWFMDYLDGKLNAEQTGILRTFLKTNPDLKEELAGLDTVHLEPDTTEYDLASSLFKPVKNPERQTMLDHFEDYCLLSVERQLSPQEETLLRDIIDEDEEKSRVYRLYGSAVLSPDKNIQYHSKSRLKKWFIHIPGVRIAVSSVAAMIVILLVLGGLFRSTGDQIAESSNIPKNTEEALNPEITEIIPDRNENISGLEQESTDVEKETLKPVEQTRTEKIDGAVDQKHTVPGKIHVADDEPIVRESIHINKLGSIGAEQLMYSSNVFTQTLAYHTGAIPAINDLHRDRQANRRSSRKFTFWKLAETVIQRLNNVSEENYTLEKRTNDYGETQRITLETPFFGLSTPAKTTGSPGG